MTKSEEDCGEDNLMETGWRRDGDGVLASETGWRWRDLKAGSGETTMAAKAKADEGGDGDGK